MAFRRLMNLSTDSVPVLVHIGTVHGLRQLGVEALLVHPALRAHERSLVTYKPSREDEMAPRSASGILKYRVGTGYREQSDPAGGAFFARVKTSDVQGFGGGAGAVKGGCEAKRM